MRLAVSTACGCTQALGRALELSVEHRRSTEQSIGKANPEADLMNEEEIAKAYM